MASNTEEKAPLISIILPTHNRADVLPFAIRSALYQTLRDFELIIVGDGCTDHTEKVVKGFNDPRICWLDLPKAPGVGYANRNVACHRARGHYIAYLAHDDIWLPDHLELLANQLEKNKKEFVYCRGVDVTPDGILWSSYFNLNNPKCLKDFLSYRRMFIPLSSVIHSKDCLDRYGYWDESLQVAGDQELYVRFLRAGELNNFGFYPMPTMLRFRALWHGRDPKWWKRPKVDAMHKFNMLSAILPQRLQFDVTPSQTEQETLWNIISQDPFAWTCEFREAVLLWMDTRLYDMDDFLPCLIAKIGSSLKIPIRLFQHRIYKAEGRRLLNKHK